MIRPQPPVTAPPEYATDFTARFVRVVHVLIAEGFSRLDAASLQNEHEETISADIVCKAMEWLNEPTQREWGRCYFIMSEHPVEGVIRDGRALKGKERPRIDIFVENSEPSPRATFVFEAKRFYPKSDETKYVGDEGLGSLLNGTKGRQDRAAGMLGYVQARSIPAVTRAVEARLSFNRAAYGLRPTDPVWAEVSLDPRIPATHLSHHARAAGLPPLAVYHSFLPCCAAALPSSPSAP